MNRWLFAAAMCLGAFPAQAQDAGVPTDSIFELAQVDPMPRPTNVDEFYAALQSAYPHALVGSGANGTVVTSFVIGADGAVRNARIVSSTVEGFDSATVQAVSRLRFTPGAVAGRAVAVRLELPVQWSAPSPDSAALQAAADEAKYGEPTLELRVVTQRPRPLNIPELQRHLERLYPPELRRSRTNGIVSVRFRVDREGKVQEPFIVSSTDHAFNPVTLQAVQYLRFEPARLDGRPVAVWVQLPIQWMVTQSEQRFPPTELHHFR